MSSLIEPGGTSVSRCAQPLKPISTIAWITFGKINRAVPEQMRIVF
jgi:hypothetical protein